MPPPNGVPTKRPSRGRKPLLEQTASDAAHTREQFQRLLTYHGVICSMSKRGNCWDTAAMESFFSSLKTERVARTVYRTRDETKADVFDYIERFYNPKRRHSTLGYLSPMQFEQQAKLAEGGVRGTRDRPCCGSIADIQGGDGSGCKPCLIALATDNLRRLCGDEQPAGSTAHLAAHYIPAQHSFRNSTNARTLGSSAL